MDENSIRNFSRIMRYAFRVNDSLRVSGQPATTFSPLPNYPPNYFLINPDNNQANPSINPSTNYQDGKNDNDDYLPFQGSIMSPIFPEELSKFLSEHSLILSLRTFSHSFSQNILSFFLF